MNIWIELHSYLQSKVCFRKQTSMNDLFIYLFLVLCHGMNYGNNSSWLKSKEKSAQLRCTGLKNSGTTRTPYLSR